jgi:hypothetical protein
MRLPVPHHAPIFINASLILALAACSSDEPPPRVYAGAGGSAAGGTGGAGGTAGTFGNPVGGDGGTTPLNPMMAPVAGGEPCVNLQCQQMECAGGATTTVSGVVLDPAGRNPLYNVVVYVPNEPVLALPSGASCDDCTALYTGHPIATALTDATGRFVLENAPVGSDIPLVIQVGKWRKQVTVPSVTGCQDNPQPDGSLRLPRNRSEGDIPSIAIATGGADTLECLLRRIGVDAEEYVAGPDGDGRVHIFQGNPLEPDDDGGGGGGRDNDVAPNTSPAAPSASSQLWSSVDTLLAYDIVLLSCEGDETTDMNQQALYEYADLGGRVFASHYHYSWFNSGPYASENLAVWTPGSQDIDDEIHGDIVTTLPNGEPFPKGLALRDWLDNVDALESGRLPIEEPRHNADVGPEHAASQPWIVAGDDSEAPGATQYFSFNTPIGGHTNPDGITYCGRVVYSDLHVGAASGDEPEQPVPDGCSDGELSPQEAALEFMLFDLSSCVTPDDVPPQPPVLVVQ